MSPSVSSFGRILYSISGPETPEIYFLKQKTQKQFALSPILKKTTVILNIKNEVGFILG